MGDRGHLLVGRFTTRSPWEPPKLTAERPNRERISFARASLILATAAFSYCILARAAILRSGHAGITKDSGDG